MTHHPPPGLIPNIRYARSRPPMVCHRKPSISAGPRAFLLSFVITQRDPNRPGSAVRATARMSGRVVWPGECPGGAGQLPTARGRHDCSSAVPAVKQAPRGCRPEFGGQGPIVSAAVASAQCRGEQRGGVAVGDQVTVTDSQHPALLMTPACSSRRQCPMQSGHSSPNGPGLLGARA
jgi:hypothetical protein